VHTFKLLALRSIFNSNELQSDEDLKLKEELDLLVVRAVDADIGVQHSALETLAQRIRESIGTMTSIPKPLKFLKEHYPSLKIAHATTADTNKVRNFRLSNNKKTKQNQEEPRMELVLQFTIT
jgi:hypothetical protein